MAIRYSLLAISYSLLAVFVLPLAAQETGDTLSFVVMGYNVENLFDARHDSLKNDYEFLPEAVRRWNHSRYRRKLDDIARVIVSAGDASEPPALVALCEVENDSVMLDLTRRSTLRRVGYRYLMTASDDERGIDVALLYRPRLFRPVDVQRISVGLLSNGRRTRDLLHVAGLLLNRDTLDVIVAHMPSRSGGEHASEPLRLYVAGRIRHVADSLMNLRQRPQLIIMGDMNDYPYNKSIREVLHAVEPPDGVGAVRARSLYHLLARKAASGRGYGSYKYNGEWGLLDHIIVNGQLLLPDAPLRTSEADAEVFRRDFLLEDDLQYGGRKPRRTYFGRKYIGGYSDHLPVCARFRLTY